tara:strand:- start:78 stop:872 length:795 start_codon:yes stop_codon:yes gene_type:complete
MKTEVRTITPVVATEMLKKNLNNRKVSENHVRFLAEEMRNGNWLFDGQPLRFDEDNVLIDGQHRLNAIIKSQTSQNLLIVTGLKKESFKVMDTGKNRNAADALSINGEQYYSTIASCAKFIIMLKSGTSDRNRIGRTSNSNIVKWLDNNRAIVDHIKTSDKLKHAFSGVLTNTYIASFLFLFAENDAVASEDFMRKLCTGLDLSEKDPIFVLRRTLIKEKTSKWNMPPKDKQALIIKGWNAYRLGKTPKFFRWNKDTDAFPNII